MVRGPGDARFVLTEVLVGLAALLDNLNNTGAESLDGGNVVREDTHVTGSGGDVHLGDGLRREDSLTSAFETTTKSGESGSARRTQCSTRRLSSECRFIVDSAGRSGAKSGGTGKPSLKVDIEIDNNRVRMISSPR